MVEGTLAEWNSPNLIGEYTLRLTVEDWADQTSNHQIQVSFNNYVARIIFPPHCLTEQTIVTINPTTHGYEFAPWDLKLNPRKLAAIEFMVDGKNEKIGVCR